MCRIHPASARSWGILLQKIGMRDRPRFENRDAKSFFTGRHEQRVCNPKQISDPFLRASLLEAFLPSNVRRFFNFSTALLCCSCLKYCWLEGYVGRAARLR
jgi:hypothetical protein